MDNVTVYNGKRTHDVGRKAALEPDPYQIQIVVDGMENGLGLSRTHLLVNEYKMQMANNQLVSMLCKDLLNDSTKKMVQYAEENQEALWILSLHGQ